MILLLEGLSLNALRFLAAKSGGQRCAKRIESGLFIRLFYRVHSELRVHLER